MWKISQINKNNETENDKETQNNFTVTIRLSKRGFMILCYDLFGLR
jgi:hypothetical protein